MMKKKLLLATAACLIATPSIAQNASSDNSMKDKLENGEVVIVTARKKEENLQNAPLSVSAFSAATIKAARIESLKDVANLTPGLNYTPLFGAQNQLPIIRGTSQTFGALNVGVFLDGIYLSGKAAADLELNDLARVEVVKGPQSALYGRNTFAGAINYVTKAPSNNFSGAVEATFGEHGLSKHVLSISGPIGEVFSYRLSGFQKKFDGFYTSSIDGGKVDFVDTNGVSLVLAAKPSENLRATLKLTGSSEDNGQPPSSVIRTNAYFGTPPGGSSTQQRNLLYLGQIPEIATNSITVNTIRRVGTEIGEYGSRAGTARASFDLKWDFSGLRLSSMTSYSHRTNDYTFDGDNTICDRTGGCPNFGYPFAPAIPFGTSRFATSSANENHKDISQELRLESRNDNPLQWMVGLFYYDNTVEAFQRSLSFSSAGIASAFSFPKAVTTAQANAAFASLSYKFNDKLSVTGELRYEKEDQTFDRNPTANTPFTDTSGVTINACKTGVTLPSDTSRCVFQLNQSFSFTTPRVTIDYKLNPETMFYTTVSKGVKAGGFNDQTNITFEQRQYKEEEALNYEIGTKNTFAGGSIRLNAAMYYIDWTNQQAACQNPATSGGTSTARTYVCNVAESAIKGAEVDFSARITDNFAIAANYSYTDARYKKFLDLSLAGTLAVLGLPAFSFKDKKLPYVPEHKLVISPRYNTSMLGMKLEMRADLSFQDKTYVRADNMQYFNSKTNLDLRATLSNENWRIQAFIDNALDDASPVAAVRFFDSTNYSVASPLVTGPARRQIGLTVGYNF